MRIKQNCIPYFQSLNDSNQTCDYYLAEIENSAQIKNNFELDNNKKCAELYKDIFNVGKLVKHSKTGKYLDENVCNTAPLSLQSISFTRIFLLVFEKPIEKYPNHKRNSFPTTSAND